MTSYSRGPTRSRKRTTHRRHPAQRQMQIPMLGQKFLDLGTSTIHSPSILPLHRNTLKHLVTLNPLQARKSDVSRMATHLSILVTVASPLDYARYRHAALYFEFENDESLKSSLMEVVGAPGFFSFSERVNSELPVSSTSMYQDRRGRGRNAKCLQILRA